MMIFGKSAKEWQGCVTKVELDLFLRPKVLKQHLLLVRGFKLVIHRIRFGARWQFSWVTR